MRRQPFLDIMNYKEFDCMPVIHWECWPETNKRWEQETGITPEQQADFFQADPFKDGSFIPVNIYLHPSFEVVTLEEAEDCRIIRQEDGVIARVLKDKSSIPHFIDYVLKDRKGWPEYKERLQFSADRFPEDWDKLVEGYRESEKLIMFPCGSMIGYLRNWMGMENLSIALYEDPDLIREMVETMSDLTCEVARRVLKDVRVDFGFFWEDICFRTGPLVSPAAFREFAVPGYRKIVSLLKEHGVTLFAVDCDGLIDDLIPIWLDCGINIMFPLEIGAWNADPMELRRRFGRELRIFGGIDKRVLEKSPKEIDEEIERRIPLMREGGYVPLLDHLIPPDVSIDNYRYYLERIRSLRFRHPQDNVQLE